MFVSPAQGAVTQCKGMQRWPNFKNSLMNPPFDAFVLVDRVKQMTPKVDWTVRSNRHPCFANCTSYRAQND